MWKCPCLLAGSTRHFAVWYLEFIAPADEPRNAFTSEGLSAKEAHKVTGCFSPLKDWEKGRDVIK